MGLSLRESGRDGGVGGDFGDHFACVDAELDAADVADGGVEGTEDQFGALEFDGATKQRVDDFHEGARFPVFQRRRRHDHIQ